MGLLYTSSQYIVPTVNNYPIPHPTLMYYTLHVNACRQARKHMHTQREQTHSSLDYTHHEGTWTISYDNGPYVVSYEGKKSCVEDLHLIVDT